MNTLYQIAANGKTYERRAWTGGDRPDIDAMNDPEYRGLVQAFYWDQLIDAGFGLNLTEEDILCLWSCTGTSAEARREIFMNRARLDAWRTLNP